MSQKRDNSNRPDAQLRSDAEELLARAARPAAPARSPSELLHELQVHQIELQMQNEELRDTQFALEEARARYQDLFEFAPVAYLTLNSDAIIEEINLSGAAMLREDRKKVIGGELSRFVTAGDSDLYYVSIRQLLKHGNRQTFDLALQCGDGSILHAQLDCIRAAERTTAPAVRVTLTDITERKRAEARIENLAFYDPLTQLPNRRLLQDRLQQALSSSARSRLLGAVLFIDLDDFKTLNDTRGHAVGDLLLQQVAHRLKNCMRVGDTVARLGGDEFVVILHELDIDRSEAASRAKSVGEKILSVLGEPYRLCSYEHRMTASVGITLFEDNRESVEELLKRADLALYRVKSVGRGKLRFFDPEMQIAATTRAVLEVDLRRGIQEGQFVLYYQPQVDQNGSLIGAEALVRWHHPSRGLLLPAEFIPFAEEKGLIEPLGQKILEAACAQLMAWQSSPDTAHLTLSANLTAQEFCHPDFVERTLAVIDRFDIDARRLVFELTESVTLGAMEGVRGNMSALKDRKVRFSLDDFGVGYSSLTYLKYLPWDEMKIDRSFIRDALNSPNDAAIARAVIHLGQTLGLSVVAEGVETEEQREFLSANGCCFFQGYLFGKPGPAEYLLRFLHRR